MKKATARLIVIAVIAMIILNGILIAMLWTKQDKSMRQMRPPISEVNDFIIEEMGFDQANATKFRNIADQHYQNQLEHQTRYREIKRQLNHAMISQNREEVELLLNELADAVKDKELELFRFFSDIKSITNEQQEREFGRIFREATGPPEYERVPMGQDQPHRPRP